MTQAGFVLMLERCARVATVTGEPLENQMTKIAFSTAQYFTTMMLANEAAFRDRSSQRCSGQRRRSPRGVLEDCCKYVSRMNFGRPHDPRYRPGGEGNTNGIALGSLVVTPVRHVGQRVRWPSMYRIPRLSIASAWRIPAAPSALARHRQPRLEAQRRRSVDHGRLVARLHGCRSERADRSRLPARTLVDVQASFAIDELIGPSPLWNDLQCCSSG